MTDKDTKVKEGHEEIRMAQKKYNKLIDAAPIRSGYNKFTGGYTTNKQQLRREKINAIKDICEDYSVFGIELLSAQQLAALDG